jgi:hypothetical protein
LGTITIEEAEFNDVPPFTPAIIDLIPVVLADVCEAHVEVEADMMFTLVGLKLFSSQ